MVKLITESLYGVTNIFSFPSPFSSVQFLSGVRLFVTMDSAHQASLFIVNSQSLFKLMSIESVMPSSHLILCHPLLLLPSIFSSFRVFFNESVLWIRWPKYWSFSFSWMDWYLLVFPMNIQNWFPLGLTSLISLQSKGLSRVFSNTTVQKHQFFSSQLSSQSNSHIHSAQNSPSQTSTVCEPWTSRCSSWI